MKRVAAIIAVVLAVSVGRSTRGVAASAHPGVSDPIAFSLGQSLSGTTAFGVATADLPSRVIAHFGLGVFHVVSGLTIDARSEKEPQASDGRSS